MQTNTTRAAISILEFARMVGICRTKVYQELKAGRVRSLKFGKRRLIPIGEVQAWLDLLEALQEGNAGV